MTTSGERLSPPYKLRCPDCSGYVLTEPECVCVHSVDIVRESLSAALDVLDSSELRMTSLHVAVLCEALLKAGVVFPTVLGAVCSECGSAGMSLREDGTVDSHDVWFKDPDAEYQLCPGVGLLPKERTSL
jgi:hypothetical protein